MRQNLLRLMTTAVCTVLITAACAGNEKEVSFKSGGMTHTFAEGKDAIPKNFPLPIYPAASTTGSVSAETDQSAEDAKFLMLSSNDSYDKVGEFYKKELAATGWKVETVQTLPKLINIAATKDAYDANVMLSSDGQKTTISLAVSKTGGENVVTPPAEEYSPDSLTPPTD
jgi:hypothetical protein